jgi:hypothetical protein
MNVPTSETTSAMNKLRKVDDLRGRQRLAELFLAEIATAICLVSSHYQHLLGAWFAQRSTRDTSDDEIADERPAVPENN